MTTNFKEFQAQDRRLCILMALEQAAGYTAPVPLLNTFLASVGHTVSFEQIEQDLIFLADKNCLTLESKDGFRIATATQRGNDCALGLLSIAGVKRPLAKA